jgi:hypothetical protein
MPTPLLSFVCAATGSARTEENRISDARRWLGNLIGRLRYGQVLNRIEPEDNQDRGDLIADPHLIGPYAKPA